MMKDTLLLTFAICILMWGPVSGQVIFERNQSPNDPVEFFASSSNFHGAAWADVNNDDFPDLFIPPGALFLNNGDGSFSRDFTSQIGFDPGLGFSSSFLQTSTHRSGVTWGDIDNDGDLDCFLVKSTVISAETLIDALYLNDGLGNFSRDTSVLWNNVETSWGAAMGDFDANGFVDIVSAHPAGFLGLTRPSSFFLNMDGNPANFVKDTTYGFTRSLAPYTVPYWSDYDLDGDQDLFIASGPGGAPGLDSLYLNVLVETGTPGFDTMDHAFVNAQQDGQCYNFIDYDNDGDKDVFIVNWTGASNQFYRNDDGIYTLLELPFSYNSSGLTNAWADVDNDGDQDVVVTNFAASRTQLYFNEGGEFILSDELFNQFGNVGAVFADVENDGKMDLYLSGPTNGALYRNVAENDHHYVHLKLEGVVSNRAAIGANVLLYTTRDGEPWVQIREVSAQNSFQGHSDLRLHFGLGEAIQIDSIVVKWPSLQEDRFYEIDQIDAILNIREGGMLTTGLDRPPSEDRFLKQLNVYPNPGHTKATLTDANPLQNKRIFLFDSKGRMIRELEWQKGVGQLEISWHTHPAGIYWIQVTAEDFSKATLKYIKRK